MQSYVGRGIVWDNHACMPLNSNATRFLSQLERCRTAVINVVSLNVGYGLHSSELSTGLGSRAIVTTIMWSELSPISMEHYCY